MSSLPPNPPPSMGAMTRTRLCGRPMMSAMSRKCSMTCVEARMVSTPSSSIQAVPDSGSRYTWSPKGTRYSPSTMTSAWAKPASTSPLRTL